MSVDLSKLRVGDQIELRDGSRHVVQEIKLNDGTWPFRIESPTWHDRDYIGHRTNGTVRTDADKASEEDIVRIHPAGGLGSALDGLSEWIDTPAVSVKHDDAKPPLALLPTGPLEEVAKVLGFGAKKYGVWNYRKTGFAYSRLISAVLRHVFAFTRGEDKDPETGLSHLAHAVCGLLFLLDQTQTGKGEDDRYREGAA